MSQPSEVRWLVFGVIGLAAVAGAVWSVRLMAVEDAEVHPVVEPALEAVPSLPGPSDTPALAPIEVVAPQRVPTPEIAVTPEPVAPEPAFAPPTEIYAGVHKLGVNRITDMARVGNVKFSRKGGELYLEGRVQRGKHWLSLSGTVETDGPKEFTLNGTIKGVPDMAWSGEAPRERVTEGRFTFRVSKNRPYWRLYEVNGKDCVCWDNCGNDFCYIDIEQQPTP